MKSAPRSRFNRSLTLGLVAATLILPACETAKVAGDIKGQFWQRTGSSDALYMRGPKAQQILHRDISRCIVELRELERLGAVKNAIPTDLDGHVLTEAEMNLAEWDSPERDKHLFAEQSDYTDFEGCMDAKGWERVEHVPYNVARKGRDNYLEAQSSYKTEYERREQAKMEKKTSQNSGDYGHLNPLTYGVNE